MPKLVHNPQTEELYHVAGDAPDPTGSDLRGQQSSLRLTKTAIGRPHVRYEGRAGTHVLEMDVYAMGTGASAHLMVHWICPNCRHALRVTSDRKQMQYDPSDGRLSMERVECTWEMDDNRQAFGLSLCRLAFAIDNNVARDA